MTLPAGAYVLVTELQEGNSNHYNTSQVQTQVSIQAQSSSTYYAYLMNQTEFDSVGAGGNASASHSISHSLATNFTWSSGPVTSCNHTIMVGNGDWFVVLYNPSATNSAVVSILVSNSNS